jgi:hypothetical protein
MRVRYYNPILMRFINADPIGFAVGSNWYAYAGNSPLMVVGPSGFCRKSISAGSWQRQVGLIVTDFIPYVSTAQPQSFDNAYVVYEASYMKLRFVKDRGEIRAEIPAPQGTDWWTLEQRCEVSGKPVPGLDLQEDGQ